MVRKEFERAAQDKSFPQDAYPSPAILCLLSHYSIAASALQKNFPELSFNCTHLWKQGVNIGRAVSIMERNKMMGAVAGRNERGGLVRHCCH